jgi:hypothetical protein
MTTQTLQETAAITVSNNKIKENEILAKQQELWPELADHMAKYYAYNGRVLCVAKFKRTYEISESWVYTFSEAMNGDLYGVKMGQIASQKLFNTKNIKDAGLELGD